MTINDEGTVEQTVRIEARPETVWKYWTDRDAMREWWGAVIDLDVRPGGACRVAMYEGPTMVGEFLELEPFTRLVMSFGWEQVGDAPPIQPGSTRVEVTLQEDAGDTILVLRHTGLPGALATQLHGEGWTRHWPALIDAIRRGSVS